MARVDALLFELKRGWPAVLMMVFGLALIAVFSMGPVWMKMDSGPKEKARIVWIGLTNGTKYRPQTSMTVVAKDSDGLSGSASMPPSAFKGCKVGDEIEVERVGLNLKLDPKSCS